MGLSELSFLIGTCGMSAAWIIFKEMGALRKLLEQTRQELAATKGRLSELEKPRPACLIAPLQRVHRFSITFGRQFLEAHGLSEGEIRYVLAGRGDQIGIGVIVEDWKSHQTIRVSANGKAERHTIFAGQPKRYLGHRSETLWERTMSDEWLPRLAFELHDGRVFRLGAVGERFLSDRRIRFSALTRSLIPSQRV